VITLDFYDGRGPSATWLGSARLTDCAACQASSAADRLAAVEDATTRDAFHTAVHGLLSYTRSAYFGDAHYPAEGWPWAWCTSDATDLVLAFDAGRTWASQRGRPWHTTRIHPDPRSPSPVMDTARPVHPVMRAWCPITGLSAADTLARSHGRLFGETAHLDLPQLAVRVLADLTTPTLAPYRDLPRDLRYAITTDEHAATMTLEVFGLDNPDRNTLSAYHVIGVLQYLPVDYGWSDPDAGPPRFEITVTILSEQHQRERAHRRDTTSRAHPAV
jgi:hypothetical protein